MALSRSLSGGGGSVFRTAARGRLLNAEEFKKAGGKGALVKIKYVRETIATFSRYSRVVITEMGRLIHETEGEIIEGAKADVTVDTRKLQKSIRRRRRTEDRDFGDRVIKGGVAAYAGHGVVIEGGAPKLGRKARPFFYKQLDRVGPRFDRGAADILAREAIRKARPRTRLP